MYVDGQAQVTWFDSDLSSRQLGDDLASGNKGFGYAFGVEAGRRIELNPDWTITPQGQLYYASVDFDDFTDPTGARVPSPRPDGRRPLPPRAPTLGPCPSRACSAGSSRCCRW